MTVRDQNLNCIQTEVKSEFIQGSDYFKYLNSATESININLYVNPRGGGEGKIDNSAET